MKLTTYNNFLLVILLVFSTIVTAQNLTISNTGESGTSGTNWSIIGNVLYIGNSGSASINTSVISNHLLNTGDLLINLPWQSGVARNININNSIAYSGSVARTLTFQSANDIVFANAVGITSATASLNVVLRSTMGLSLGAPDNGLVKMDGINIDTKGGHFWVGGGTSSTIWNGLTVGNSYAVTWLDDVPGISLVGSTIATNGGNISMYAQSNNTSDDDGVNYGINFENSVMSSGTGSIYLAGGVYGRFNNGIGMRVNGTSATSITSTTGAITIYGYGTDATTNGNFWRTATMINGSVSIKSGSGNIAVTGEAAFASPVNDKEGLVIVDGSAICSQSGSITLRGTNTLETSGQYSNSIRFAAANIANSIRIGYDGTNAYSGNISIEGNSIYQRNTNAGGGSIAVQTTGTLTIQPTGTAFTYMRAGNSGTLTYDDDWNFGTTLGGFTFGKTTNTTNITLSNPLTTDGPISIYGGNILAQQNITSTLPGADILLQATGAINLSASMTIQTNVGDVTLNATSGGTATIADSAIYLNSSSQILSNGGNITLGGGYSGSEGNLYAATTNVGGGYAVRMDAATILNAAGGNINIYGRNVLSYGDGIYLNAVVISTVGSGTIGIYGDSYGGYNGTTYFGGLTFENNASIIQNVNGNITLKGILTDSQSTEGYAINFYRSSGSAGQTRHIQILSQTGDIQITGDRGSSTGGGIGHSSWGNIYFGSPSDNSFTASGDVKFTYSNLVNASSNGFKVKTTGAVTYEPVATSFIAAQTFPVNVNYILADNATSLTIGKTGNTAGVTIGSNISIAGPISVYAGTITLNANLTSTDSGDISLFSDAALAGLLSARTITTSGAVKYMPNSPSFSSTVTFPITNLTLTDVTGLQLGKSGNTSGITIGTAASVNGYVTVFGGALALNANLTTTNTTTGNINLNGTTISGTGNMVLADGRTAEVNVSSASTYDGIISGTGSGLTKAGTGLVTLTKDHTYTGATTISAGDLQLGTGGSVSQASSGTVSNTSGVAVASGSKLILSPNENIIFAAPISGAGGVEIKGMSGRYLNTWLSGTPILLAANTTVLEALTRITGGLMGGNAITGGSATCGAYQKYYTASTNTATLQLQVYNGVSSTYYTKCVFVKLTQSGSNVMIQVNTTILGTGAGYRNGNVLGADISVGGSSMVLATVSGTAGYGISEVYLSGKVNFTGNLTYTGNTELSNTITNVSNATNISSYTSKGTQEITDASSSFPAASTLVNNGLVIFNRATPLTISSNMEGTEEVLQVGADITLTGTNTHTGITTIDLNKKLNIGSGSTTGSITGNVVNYGTLTFDRSDASTHTGVISGSGSLVKSGAGAHTLTGLNTYAGATTINAGKLVLERDVPITSTSSYSGAGTLVIQPSSSSFTSAVSYPIAGFTVSNAIGGLTIGKLTNTANITFGNTTTIAGPITVYGGTIAVNENLNTTAGNAVGDLLLKASGDISLASAKSITTAGGDVILWSNSDGQISNGGVFLNPLSTLSTGGGHIWIGGGNGTSTWNGLTVGNGYAVSGKSVRFWQAGVMLDETKLQSQGGNIYIAGKRNTGNESGAGIINYSGSTGTLIDSGTGTITMIGEAEEVNSWADFGIMAGLHPTEYSGTFTIRSSNASAATAISLFGSSKSIEDGILIENRTRILSTATANGGGISISGSAASRNALSVGIGSNPGTLEVLSSSGTIDVNIGTYPLLIANASNFRLGSIASDTDVPSSTANVLITSNNVNWTGNVPVRTTGTLRVTPTANNSFASAFNTSSLNYTGISGLTIGNPTNTSNITFGATTTIAGPITAYGGIIAINAALTATNSTINLTASIAATQTAAITANGLALNGAGTFTLNNTANSIATIAGGSPAAKIGSLSFVDAAGGLEIGTVNPTGITSTGPIKIETLEGNITLSENLATDDITADAIILNAGKIAAIGTRTGGNIIVSGTPTLTYGSGGRAKLFSGDNMNSTGLTTLVGGVGNTRVNVDETTATFSPVLANDISFALYRAEDLQAPTISNFNNISKMYYDGSYKIVAPTTNSLGAFSYTSSNTAVATISGTTVTILSAGTSTITANQASNASYASGSITATLTVSSVSVLTNTGAISSTNLNYVNKYGQIGGSDAVNKYGKSIRTKTYDLSNGLVMHLDAGNAASYPGTGTIWTDLSGFGNNGTLVSGPTYNSSNSGYLVFNGTTTYVDAPLTKTASCTFSVWAKSTSAPSRMLFNAGNDGTGPDLLFHIGVLSWNTWDSSANPFGSIPATALNGNWHNYVVVNDAVSNITKLYYDGVLYGTAGYVNASATTALYIGGSSSGYRWNGAIGVFQVHNRVLTPSDVLENFNNLKTRYGL